MNPKPHLPQSQVARAIASQDPRTFALFLGAGASKSSGVSLAGEMIEEWRKRAHTDYGPGTDFDSWCDKQDWYKKDDEYSRLFELVCIDPPSRQKYIEGKMKNAFPSWGYLYLANIIQQGRFNVVFTTNFDDLINEALTIFLGYNPVVCAADSELSSINLLSARAKIIKLHGDYLFESIKNTTEELHRLTTNMERKFKEFAASCGFVVIGYNGGDESIMHVFEGLMKDPHSFHYGVYWGVRPGKEAAPRVAALADAHPRRFHLFECQDFDVFMAQMHEMVGRDEAGEPCPLELPKAILNPYQAMEQRYQRLLTVAGSQAPTNPRIAQDVEHLREELETKRPWADAKADEFDLLQAQMELGKRDYKKAIEVVGRFIAKHPHHPEGLTTWGNALMVQSEEEGSAAAAEEAVAKWKEALGHDPKALGPRYGLARYYALKQRSAEGITISEELVKLAPNDPGLRRNLVQFYGSAGRYDDAERELQWLLQRDPDSAELHGFRSSLLEQRGLIAEAIEELRKSAALAPQNPWVRFGFGLGLAKTNRLDEAATEFEEAIRLDPRNINFRIQVATFYAMQNQPQRALPHLQTATAFAPQSAEARGWLCQIWQALGNLPAAQTEGEEAVRLSPNDTRLRITVGLAYQMANRWQEAERHYLAATQANPNAPDGYAALGRLYFMQNRTAELNSIFQRLGQINPQAAQMLQMQLQQIRQMAPQGGQQNWLGALQEQVRSFVQGASPPPVPSWPSANPPPSNPWSNRR